MADKEHVIAVDSGTQSVRAILFDSEGREVTIAQAPHKPYFSLQPGWAEQDTADYWEQFCQVTKRVMKESRVDPKAIAGLGITTQRTTSIPVDRDGKALRPAIIWLDQRKTDTPPPLSTGARALFGVAGLSEAIRYVRKHSKFLWIRDHEPEVYRNTHKFLQVSGWFVKKLTGEFKDSVGMVTGLWPLDFKKLAWHSLGMVYEAFGAEPSQMVDVFAPDTVLGHVTGPAAAETGLPEGLPVVVGAGDKQSELLGAGGIDPEIGVISFGTAACMDIITRRYVSDGALRFFAWPGAVPRTWDIEMFIYRGFWMITWFKQEFGYRESLEAERREIPPEAIFDEVIRSIPAGSMGLMLQPHWSPMTSSKFGKGSIIGFGDVHTRAHIYRAILEGIGYELRRLYELVRKKTGVTVSEIRVGGGGSRSDAAVQIAADIFNLPVSRLATSEICALGAAIDAAVGCGMFGSFESAVASMVKKGRTFEPVPASHRVYDDLYHGVYAATYNKLEPLYRKIASITGYPPAD
ncbi:MAG: FGGY-family carbohydrate kinase [Spirochaetes bacterium]|nr:FGGY-family carbohydrate kinase [Spirochaetota bacterium]